MSERVPLSTPDSWTLGSWLWEKLYHISDTDSKHILSLENCVPALQAAATRAVAVSSNDHFIFLSGQLL